MTEHNEANEVQAQGITAQAQLARTCNKCGEPTRNEAHCSKCAPLCNTCAENERKALWPEEITPQGQLAKRCTWPFDPDAAHTIECYVVKAPAAKLYVWREKEQATWNYTMSAGRNSDRSHTGCVVVSDIDAQQAAQLAIAACKKSNSWTL